MTKPIFKAKFSHPLSYKVAEKVDKSRLVNSLHSELISATEGKSYFASFEKLYRGSEKQQKDQKTTTASKADRSFNALVLIAGKIFFSLRNPVGPYFLERVLIH